MNTLGTLLRVSVFGESHGPLIGATLDGCPPGIALDTEHFSFDLNRRKAGGLGTTSRIEDDMPILATGVFNGKTTGAPLTILFENKNIQSKDYEFVKNISRPGHSDFVLREKFRGFNDYRGGGHSSGRLTLALVAAGVVAKKICGGIDILAQLTEAGGLKDVNRALAIAVEQNDSIGGIVTCTIKGLPIGLGEPFFNSLESLISHAIFSIPAVKGIEFGSGFKSAQMTGSRHNDPIIDDAGTTSSNHAGGINGGIANGNPITFRVAVKPASSTPQPQKTWNNSTKKMETLSVKGRHDLCIALRVPVVAEAATALVLADLMLLSGRH